MNIAFLIASPRGYELAKKCKKKLEAEGEKICLYVKASHLEATKEDLSDESIHILSENETLSMEVTRLFFTMDALVFVGAVGIAARLVAPLLVHKSIDPAIVVVDEGASFCLSFLSGHMGGANELTARIAKLVDATPVITTASDNQKKIAIDIFAKKNGFYITDWEKAKQLTADILYGFPILVDCKLPTKGKLPEGYYFAKADNANVIVSPYLNEKEGALSLVPRVLTVGIGCRRDTPTKLIEEALLETLKQNNLSINAIKKISSIDVKKDEAGLLELCQKYDLEFETYSKEELEAVPGEFSYSEFVFNSVGIGNVCERSAMHDGGRLIVEKTTFKEVTIAVSMCEEIKLWEDWQ